MPHQVATPERRRLFGGISDKKPMRLVDAQTIECGIAVLTYERFRTSGR